MSGIHHDAGFVLLVLLLMIVSPVADLHCQRKQLDDRRDHPFANPVTSRI